MSTSLIVLIVVIAVIVIWVIGIYNTLVHLRNNRESAFANIDVQLQQRHDLVPQLVATVKGYAQHEKTLLESVTAAAFETGAATLGTAVTDTIKLVNDENVIESTPVRTQLRAVQTPQVFERDLYSFAMENAGDDLSNFTDDCSLIEGMGGEVAVVEGSRENIKLTTPIDIVIAESILKDRAEA